METQGGPGSRIGAKTPEIAEAPALLAALTEMDEAEADTIGWREGRARVVAKRMDDFIDEVLAPLSRGERGRG